MLLLMGMLHEVGEVKPEKGEGWQCYRVFERRSQGAKQKSFHVATFCGRFNMHFSVSDANSLVLIIQQRILTKLPSLL